MRVVYVARFQVILDIANNMQQNLKLAFKLAFNPRLLEL